jgi:hypothetical protein
LGFFWQYIICSLVFPICPLCPFVKCFISLFLIIYIKGQIDYHLEEFVMVILLAQKFPYFMHKFVSGSLLVINDLFVVDC